jgi:hypothetical protein
MQPHDVDRLTAELKAIAEEAATLCSLGAFLKVRVNHAIERVLEAATTAEPPANNADAGTIPVDEAPWRKVAETVRSLPGRRAKLIEGYLRRGGAPAPRRGRNGSQTASL